MTEPPETSELLAFVHTVDARSLSRAAVELGVPRVVGRVASYTPTTVRRTESCPDPGSGGELLRRHVEALGQHERYGGFDEGRAPVLRGQCRSPAGRADVSARAQQSRRHDARV